MQRLLTHGVAIVVAIVGAGCTADIVDSPGPGDPGGTPTPVTITGPDVLPHVQAFADAACGALHTCMISTYEGHHPTATRALDTLVSDAYGERPTDNNELGDALAAEIPRTFRTARRGFPFDMIEAALMSQISHISRMR